MEVNIGKNQPEMDSKDVQQSDSEARNLIFPVSRIRKIIEEDNDIKSVGKNAALMISGAVVSGRLALLDFVLLYTSLAAACYIID